MDNPRILPPLVRGKVTSLFDFFIDEIALCKNVLCLTETLDITAQVRWWGEILPAYIRPKILQLQHKISCSSQSIEAHSHSVRYKIRTSVDLFKKYLKACEVVELSVYEGIGNYVIGSAFLKNLSNLLNKNNDCISMPIIDYSGEEIGQMKIHTNFFGYPQNNTNNRSHICENESSSTNVDMSGEEVSEILKHNYVFPNKFLFYDGCSKITNLEFESDQKSESDRYSLKNKDSVSDLVLHNYESEILLKNHFPNQVKELSKPITLPDVHISKESSKILNFDLDLKTKKPEKINKSKLCSKFTINSTQSKSKLKSGKSNLGISTDKERFPKKTVSKTLLLEKPNVAITNEMDTKQTCREQSNKSFGLESSKLDIVTETCTNKMVFDYLLGAAMTKEKEESAMKNFKKMSPSHDIVCSINELCLTSDKGKICENKSMNNLYFDLTNPIERNYYEKFFVKNNLVDFEIVELLNEPKGSCALREAKLSERNSLKGSLKVGNSSIDEPVLRKCNLAIGNLSNGNKITDNHARCKYHKKLEELDTIIESLKFFEKNMIKQEKRLQLDFEDNLNKQSCKVSDR